MWSKFRLVAAQRSKLPTVEEWAERNANKASPDGIIAAVVVESLAKHWDDWVAKDLEKKTSHWEEPTHRPKLVNAKKNITIQFGVRRRRFREGNYNHYASDWQSQGTTVNNLEIELRAARHIVASYKKLAKLHETAQQTAARIQAEQAISKKKWDLAENLLGFTRDAKGALKPIKTAEA